MDIENAPRNEAGLVEYAADFYILRPWTCRLYDVNNRGKLMMLQFFSDAVHSNARQSRSMRATGT